MPRHLLLVTDGERDADAAATLAFELGARHGADVRVLAPFDPRSQPVRAGETRCDELLSRVRMQLEDVGGPAASCEIRLRRGPVVRAIADEVRAGGAELVVIGGRNLTPSTLAFRWALAAHVSRSASVSVLVPAPDADHLPTRAIAAIDFGTASTRAARAALDILDAPAVLELVQVVPAPWLDRSQRATRAPSAWELACYDAAARRLAALARELAVPPAVDVERVVLAGAVPDELARHTARERADLLVTTAGGEAPHTMSGEPECAPSCSVLVVPSAARHDARPVRLGPGVGRAGTLAPV